MNDRTFGGGGGEFKELWSPRWNYIDRRKPKDSILSVALYGYKNWSVTIREEHRLREFENRVLWRIFDLRTMK
jgi:hypothetical protein